MKLKPLILSAWLVPLLAFPVCDTWWTPPVRFAHYVDTCYAPVVFLAKAPAAEFFVQHQDIYTLSPHWRYWLYWVAGAMVLTVYAGKRRE